MTSLPVLARLAEADPPLPSSVKRGERLRRLARWTDLLAEELDALELGDFPLMRDIAERRAALEAEIEALAVRDEERSFPEIFAAAVAESVQSLEEWTAQERLTRDELAQLHDGSLLLVREMPQVTQGGGYPILDEVGSQLNVRL